MSDEIKLTLNPVVAPAADAAVAVAAEEAAQEAEAIVAQVEADAAQKQQFSEEGYPLDEMGNPIIPDREITITAQNALLYPLDESGNLSGDGAETLSFTNYANFAIKASAAVQPTPFSSSPTKSVL